MDRAERPGVTEDSNERIHVEWQRLLDVYQGLEPLDEGLAGWLECASGTVTCPLFLADEFESLKADGRIIKLPVKSVQMHLLQRQQFAETCCEPKLRKALLLALTTESPFFGFDEVLETVPIEATRWREELREQDQLALERWLSRAGISVEPSAVIKRTVIEFPIRRDG